MTTRVRQSIMHAHMAAQDMKPTFSPVDPPKRKRNNEESRAQQQVVKWWAMACRGFGVAEILLMSIPNGGGRSGPVVGAIMQREGLRKGAPDLMLCVPRPRGSLLLIDNDRSGIGWRSMPDYCALFVEMKTATGRVSPEQEVMHGFLIARGYKVVVCRSAEEAIREISSYLTQ